MSVLWLAHPITGDTEPIANTNITAQLANTIARSNKLYSLEPKTKNSQDTLLMGFSFVEEN
jgi:hypothetical protein